MAAAAGVSDASPSPSPSAAQAVEEAMVISSDDELPDVPGCVIGAPVGPPNPEAWAQLFKRTRSLEARQRVGELANLAKRVRQPLVPLNTRGTSGASCSAVAAQAGSPQPQSGYASGSPTVRQHGEGMCPICRESPPNCLLSCGHVFCEPCIKQWKAVQRTCPICRSAFRKWTTFHPA